MQFKQRPNGPLNWDFGIVVIGERPHAEGQGDDGDFTGTLPMSWPNDISQVLINIDDDPYQPLFPFGFGLSYPKEMQFGLARHLTGEGLRQHAPHGSRTSAIGWGP